MGRLFQSSIYKERGKSLVLKMTEAEAWRQGNVVFLGQQGRLINNAKEVARRRSERHAENGEPVVISRAGKYIPAMIVPKQKLGSGLNMPSE